MLGDAIPQPSRQHTQQTIPLPQPRRKPFKRSEVLAVRFRGTPTALVLPAASPFAAASFLFSQEFCPLSSEYPRLIDETARRWASKRMEQKSCLERNAERVHGQMFVRSL